MILPDMPDSPQSLQEPILTALDDQNETMYSEGMDGGGGQKTYTNLDTSKTWSTKLVTARGNSVDLRSWTMCHPEEWSTREVLDWIFSVVQLINNIQFDQFPGEKFNQFTGKDLCKMSREQFCQLEPTYGDKLYSVLNEMLNRAAFQEPPSVEYHSHPLDNQSFTITHQVSPDSQLADELGKCIYNEHGEYGSMCLPSIAEWLDHSLDDPGLSCYKIGASGCDSLSPMQQSEAMYPVTPPDEVLFYHQAMDSFTMRDQLGVPDFQIPTDTTQTFLPHVKPSQIVKEPLHPYGGRSVSRRGPGRPRRKPRISTSDYESDGDQRTPGKPKGPGTHKGNHLWEFIRDLLKDPKCTNHLIRWENKCEGVFKIVSSEQVARLWGAKKNNHTMTYEKFSRAMRFCRSAGYFSDVPKNGNYPKKLCFKFGPKSYGWKD